MLTLLLISSAVVDDFHVGVNVLRTFELVLS